VALIHCEYWRISKTRHLGQDSTVVFTDYYTLLLCVAAVISCIVAFNIEFCSFNEIAGQMQFCILHRQPL